MDQRLVASALRWWDDAGVDNLVDEAPRQWLRPDDQMMQPQPEPSPVDVLPDTLDGLVHWLMTSDTLSPTIPPHRRVAPFGTPGSPIMVLTDMPEQDDAEVGTLFSGETGDLIDRMLNALGLDRSKIYCASLCPARPPTGRIDDALLPKLSEIAKLHIRLAAPRRVWLLGQAASRAVLGMDEVAAKGKLHLINQEAPIMEAVASIHPRLLLQNPKRKAGVWEDMQLLAGGLVA